MVGSPPKASEEATQEDWSPLVLYIYRYLLQHFYLIVRRYRNNNMSQKKHEPWKNNERHYCACCNVWMGSDRQSILIHDSGKKHRDNMEASLQQRRDDKLQEENDAGAMAKTLKLMEEAAAKSYATDVASGSFAQTYSQSSTSTSGALQQTHAGSSVAVEAKVRTQGELTSWQDRKAKRTKVESDPDDSAAAAVTKSKRIRIELRPHEGHYTIGQYTYLEGETDTTSNSYQAPIRASFLFFPFETNLVLITHCCRKRICANI